MDANPKVFTIWIFFQKKFTIPGLDKKYCLSHKGSRFFLINEQIKSLFNEAISYKTA